MSKEDSTDALVGMAIVAGIATIGAWLIGFGTVGGWIAAAATGVFALAWKGIAWITTLAITTLLQTVATAAAVIVGGVLARRYLFKNKSVSKVADESEVLSQFEQREKQ